MNISEANHLNTLLDYILSRPSPTGEYWTLDEIEKTAVWLADRAHAALGAGYTGDAVRELWDVTACGCICDEDYDEPPGRPIDTLITTGDRL